MLTPKKNLSSIFEKLNDLKSIFKFAEKVVPIIQGLTEFMKEVVPLLENINTSIADSTSKIPQATDQIKNVTNATELATTEILDLVDKISERIQKSESVIRELIEKEITKHKKLNELKAEIAGNSKAMSILDEFLKENNTQKYLENLAANLSDVSEDSYRITLSLQVQDITAQQLSAVNHLIQSVHTKLTSLIESIDNADLDNDLKTFKEKYETAKTFDPNASYTNSTDRQRLADQLVNKNFEKTSQEEIDKLFK